MMHSMCITFKNAMKLGGRSLSKINKQSRNKKMFVKRVLVKHVEDAKVITDQIL